MGTEERGTLYQFISLPAMPGRSEVFLLLKWAEFVGPFEDWVSLIGRPAYRLRLDDRISEERRTGEPGYIVFGYGPMAMGCSVVGIFIPEGMEDQVKQQLEKDFSDKRIIFLPKTIDEL